MNAAAQNQKITPPLSGMEERVRSSLLAMSDYLKTSKSYSFKADVQYDDVLPSGQKIQFAASSDISIRRPNGLFANQISDNGSRRLWFDGKQLTLFDPGNLTYAVDAFSGNTDKALEHMNTILRYTPPGRLSLGRPFQGAYTHQHTWVLGRDQPRRGGHLSTFCLR